MSSPSSQQPDHPQDPHLAPTGGFDLVEFATRRRVTIAMMTLTLVLFGLIALGSLKVNLLPDLSYPTLTVRTDYEGAAPAEVETLISQPAEEALGVVKGLRKLKSVSRTGQSDVVLEFAWGTDMDQAGLEVRDKMEALQFPLDAKPPVLLRFNPSTQPIMRLALSPKDQQAGPEEGVRQLMELRRFADDDLKRKLEPVDGVAAVKVGGGLEDQVQVDIDQRKLAQYGLSLENVINRLAQENVNVSGGRLEEGSQRYLVRTVNQFATVEEMANMLLTTRTAGAASNGAAEQALRLAAASGDARVMAALSQGGGDAQSGTSPLRLRDVATVRQGYKEREAIIRLNGREAVELAIYKEGDANTVSTADALEAKLKSIREKLPADIELTTIEDQSKFIRNAINDVKFDGVIGGMLSVLIIFLFLRDGWSTFVISLSLPVSIVATFFFMGQLGLSLNVMSLGGLALATGLVVDDSIVVLESIAKARERGLGILEAAIAGTREVSMAVVASTLTTIAVFLPLVFVQGIAGQLFRDQALTVAIAIGVSLVVAMTLIPMLSALKGRPPLGFPAEAAHLHWQPHGKWQKPAAYAGRGLGAMFRYAFFAIAWGIVRAWRGWPRSSARSCARPATWRWRPTARAERAYLRVLPNALQRPLPVLAVAALAFALTMAAVPMLGTDLIPQFAQDRFDMTAKLPPGTPLAQTDALIRDVQAAHAKDGGVRVLYGVSGSGTRLDANPTESGENIGKLSVVMTSNDAEGSLTEALRKTMRQFPGVQVDFSRPELFSLSPPLEIEVEAPGPGDHPQGRQQAGGHAARQPALRRRQVDGGAGLPGDPDPLRPGPRRRARPDHAADRRRRWSTRCMATWPRATASATARSTCWCARRNRTAPRSRHPPADRESRQRRAGGTGGGGRRGRHHRSQRDPSRRPAPRRDRLGEPARHRPRRRGPRSATSMVANDPLGADIDMRIGGQGQELGESIRSLLFAFGLAIFLVYLVMASQFESLLHPFVILFTIPLALVGAVAALLLTRSPASVVVFIGLILLVGLVVKNAIILIDKVNQLREEGVAKRNALVEGARSRLRPIMMTTLCAVFGFLPLALAFGEGAEVRRPMAITVIGGLLVSTLLTLLVIPLMYDLLDRKPDAYYAERGRRARSVAEQAAEVIAHEHDPLNGGAKA